MIGNVVIVVATCLWSIFMALFVTSFLHAREHLLWFHKSMRLFIYCMLLTIFVSLLGFYSVGILSVAVFGIPAALSGIVAGVQSWKAGYAPASRNW